MFRINHTPLAMTTANRLRLDLVRAASLVLALGALLPACASTPPPAAAEPISLDAPAVVLDGERYLEYRVGVRIAAPPAEVWALLTDAARFVRKNPGQTTNTSIPQGCSSWRKVSLSATTPAFVAV